MALSGSTVVRATTQNNLLFSWAAVQSAAANSSTVSWQLLLEAKQYGRIDASPGSPWEVVIDGQTFTGTTSLAIGSNETKVLASGSVALEHAADGSRSFSYSFSQEFWIDFGGEYITAVSGSGEAVLDTIARASQPSVSASSAALGSGLTIYTNRVSSFTHTLEYRFGNASGVIAQGVGDSVRWIPPLDLAGQIPGAVSGTAIITCTTYANGVGIGSKQVTVALTLPESIVPTASASWEDASGAYGKVGCLTQNVSRLAVQVSGTGAYGSAITGAAVTLGGKAYGGGTITDSGELSLVVSVTDSRGRTGYAEYPLTVAAYSVPSLTLSASRCLADGTADDTGDHARITVTGYVTEVNGSNSGTLRLTYGGSAETVSLGTGNVSYQKTVYADPNATMPITAELSDKLVSSSRAMVLSTGYATMDLLAGGRGVSFGKAATREGFDCAMPAYFTGGLNGFLESTSYPKCWYRTVDGETEWENPPMIAGTEYRTTERYDGAPVYRKLIPLGNLPNATIKRYYGVFSHRDVVELKLYIKHENGEFRGVSVYGSSTASVWAEELSAVAVNTNSWDASGYLGYALAKYTK